MKLYWLMLPNVLLMTGNDGESMLFLKCFVALGMVGSVVFWTGKRKCIQGVFNMSSILGLMMVDIDLRCCLTSGKARLQK